MTHLSPDTVSSSAGFHQCFFSPIAFFFFFFFFFFLSDPTPRSLLRWFLLRLCPSPARPHARPTCSQAFFHASVFFSPRTAHSLPHVIYLSVLLPTLSFLFFSTSSSPPYILVTPRTVCIDVRGPRALGCFRRGIALTSICVSGLGFSSPMRD